MAEARGVGSCLGLSKCIFVLSCIEARVLRQQGQNAGMPCQGGHCPVLVALDAPMTNPDPHRGLDVMMPDATPAFLV